MRTYTTQMDAARQGIITPEMKEVAKKEYRTEEEIRDLVAKGQAVICANRLHTCLNPNGVGSMLRTKINVNLGVSRDCKDYDVEMQKVMAAVDMGAEAIMDLSSFGDTRKFRRCLTEKCPAMIGTVPIYDAVVYYNKPLAQITAAEWIDIARMHAMDGVDFMTVHCGINRETAEKFKKNKRLTNIVSRGGSIIFAWMEMTGRRTPRRRRLMEEIKAKLDTMRRLSINIDLTEEIKAHMIDRRMEGAGEVDSFTIEATCCRSTSISAWSTASAARCTRSSTPRRCTATQDEKPDHDGVDRPAQAPLNNNATTIPLKTYLLSRIEGMKNQHNKLTRDKILFESIYRELGDLDSDKKRKKRIRDYTEIVLTHFISMKYITRYEMVKEGRTITGVRIFWNEKSA